MMETIRSWSGVIALVILAIVFVAGMLGHKNAGFGSTSCGSITCLEGGLRLVSDVGGDFESDVAAVFASTVNIAGAVSLTSTFKLGTNGTAQSNQVTTTCSPKADVSITASTTGYAYCTGVTGVTSSDNVIAQFASTTPTTYTATDNWVIVSAKASTTAGAVDIYLMNLTGGTRAPSASSKVASTTTLWVSH